MEESGPWPRDLLCSRGRPGERGGGRRPRRVRMGFMTGVVLVLLGLLLAIGMFFVGRYLLRVWRHPERTWVERSGLERRRRKLPVPFHKPGGPPPPEAH